MNDAFAIGMGYGNIFVDIDGVTTCTSVQSLHALAETMFIILNAMTRDISQLTGLSEFQVQKDYLQECGCDMMYNAFEAVTKKQCRPYIESDHTLTFQCLAEIKKVNKKIHKGELL